MKKRNKKEEKILVDLNARKSITIIHAQKKNISDKEMKEFEEKLTIRYNAYCEFTDFCIKRNMERNSEQISKKIFTEALQSMLEQNKLLEDMINFKEQDE